MTGRRPARTKARREPPPSARCPLCGIDGPAVQKRGRPIYACPRCAIEFGPSLSTSPAPEARP